MITFDTRGDTPFSVRLVRMVVPLFLFFAYLAFRVYPAADGRIPLGEVVVMGVVLIVLVFTGLIALGDLIYPLTPRARRHLSTTDLEITAVHEPITTDIAAAIEAAVEQSWPRSTGTLLQPAVEQMARDLGYSPDAVETVARMTAEATLTDDTVPRLYTHEYQAQHHTPPRGFRVQGTVTGRIPADGRHHRADED